MKPFIDTLNVLLPILYIITFIIYSYDFGRGNNKYANSKRLFLFITLLVHLSYLLLRTMKFEHPPITNVFEIFTVIAFAIAFSYFILELLTDIRGTGPFIIIFSVLFQTISSIFITDEFFVKEVLKNNLLGFHVFTALIGYSAITISAVYGFLYLMLYKEIKTNRFGLIYERMPNLEVLEQLSFYSAVIGFAMLTIAIIIGLIWLPQAFPKFSFIDPKIIGTALVWILYGVGILSKVLGKWQGKKLVAILIGGFLIAILSTMVTNFISQSFHSFY
ncbi:MAG TPA: cytochrome C biogenesis protein [Ignavibacteria bacterium]|nr:cytochrome C biogenesis protein [Ignavibacteria bacterium]